jgi:hypothetical protein
MKRSAELWAEYASAEQLLSAAAELERSGVRAAGAYTPFGVRALERGTRPRLIPWLVFAAALCGGTLSFVVIWWTASVDYPLDVGGRPLNSVPADIPIVFESSILFAAVTAFLSVLVSSGMPRLTHPLEKVPGFARTSLDRYWLGAEPTEAADEEALNGLLERTGALRVHRVTGSEP